MNGFTLELVPHCASISREGWVGDHDSRPLSPDGHRQAGALVEALGGSVDAIYSSPALRCAQTVEPLARATGLSIVELPELRETEGFAGPAVWTGVIYADIAQAIGGAWAAGRGLSAVTRMSQAGGRVVACSHGDLIPAMIAMFCAAYDTPLPRVPDRGGWYTVQFDGSRFAVTTKGPEYLAG